ncbi:MAG: ribbon-helix-helix domain-containing protein [Acidimicrobiales bacterium]
MAIQIAVKLPEVLLIELDRLVEGGAYDSRSQAVRAGVEAVVSAGRRQQLERRYREAFHRLPETEEEMGEATRLAVQAIGDEPWERWW